MNKQIHGAEARKAMMEGIDQLADVVGSTMGAKGRNVILDLGDRPPMVVNDGKTIAKEIHFKDNVKNMSVQMVKEAAERTDFQAGDGTTTSTVLTRAIIKEGWKMVDEGANPVQLRRELLEACDKIIERLKEMAQKVDSEERAVQIATVSAQDKELGEKIGKLIYKLGKNAVIFPRIGTKKGFFVENETGSMLEGSIQKANHLAGKQFNGAWGMEFEHAKVIILKDSPEDHELDSKAMPLMKKIGNSLLENSNLIFIAEKMSQRFLMQLAANNDKLKWCWFRPTTAGKNMTEVYKDISAITGAKIVENSSGVFLQDLELEDLGNILKTRVDNRAIIFNVDPKQLSGDRYLGRISEVKAQIEDAEDEKQQEQTKERYAHLIGGVATVRVAGATVADTEELMLRIEDAINATRSAMEGGYLPGGGVALLNASRKIKGNNYGEEVLKFACERPMEQILENAGFDNRDASGLRDGEGYDVLTDLKVNMIEAGIIDPLKVVKMALLNSVSVAGLLLTSEFSVVEEDDDLERLKEILKKK